MLQSPPSSLLDDLDHAAVTWDTINFQVLSLIGKLHQAVEEHKGIIRHLSHEDWSKSADLSAPRRAGASTRIVEYVDDPLNTGVVLQGDKYALEIAPVLYSSKDGHDIAHIGVASKVYILLEVGNRKCNGRL